MSEILNYRRMLISPSLLEINKIFSYQVTLTNILEQSLFCDYSLSSTVYDKNIVALSKVDFQKQNCCKGMEFALIKLARLSAIHRYNKTHLIKRLFNSRKFGTFGLFSDLTNL